MKNALPYILSGAALIVLIVLVVTTPWPKNRKLDERITLRQKDKIPYGTFAAYHLLPALFPNAEVKLERRSPLDWPFDPERTSGQAMILIARDFEPEEHELIRINRYVTQGNYVFIITNSLSNDAAKHFGSSASGAIVYIQPEDSLQLRLNKPPFNKSQSYVYPGKKWDGYFSEIDKERTRIIGNNKIGQPNFIQLQSGRGKVFVHLAPLAFSNYFILHKANSHYYSQAFSLIPASVNTVIWNEYFLTRRRQPEKNPHFLSVLWQYPSFRWAMLTAIGTLLLFALIEMRRRQRPIPFLQKPKNDSLDYVRTLGRLYYDRKDHQNLARKMTILFLDAIHSRYHLPTTELDAHFLDELHAKSGYNKVALQQLIETMQQAQQQNRISEQELASLHLQLENFYQNT